MKKTKLLSLALATLMLGACSSEDVVVNEGSVPPGGNGYLSFAFNLPTTPSSRANDNFDDGEDYEYKVKDATLLLFAGNDEANSKFQGAYNLTLPETSEKPGYNVTTRYSIVQQVTKPGSGNVYAMVILNGKASGVVKELAAGTWTLNGDQLTDQTTFSSLYSTAKKMNLADIANTTGGCFLMTNAPMFTAPGGTSNPTAGEPRGQVQTLSVIDRDRIYATEAEAKANPATDIYCERAVAKVTVKNNVLSSFVPENQKITAFDFKGWTLDITSRESFLVRNVADPNWWGYKSSTNGVTDYRFVGSVGLTNTATQTLYRTYWGIDPTYDGKGYNTTQVDKDHFNTTIGAVPTLTDMDKDAYCLENTFDVDNQNQNQTTRVIVAAQLTVKGANGDKSFFILNDNKDVIYDTEDKIKEIVSTAYMNVPEIRQVLETNLKAGKKLDNSDLTVTFTKPADNAGYWTVASITVNPASASNFNTGTIPAELTESNPTYTAAIASVNKDYNIAYYAGGVSYYGVRIRHFDENQTPWAPNGDDDSYEVASGKDKDNEYLGRYGVLRNNWYEVNVTGIRNIGSPVPDEVYGQDDPQEQWISVRINVLAWAKRSQNVDL